MITKRTSIIRLTVCLAAFVALFIYTLIEGDNFSDVLGWFALGWLLFNRNAHLFDLQKKVMG